MAAVEKLHALVVGTANHEEGGPSTSRAKAPVKAPKVRPFDLDDVPVKTFQVGAEPSQKACIAGNLGEK